MAIPGSGITNAQASYLADLQRQLGLPYTGAGMTRTEAAGAIDALIERRRELRAEAKERVRASV